MIKNLRQSIPLVLLFLVFACNEIDELTHFNIEYNESVTIKSSTVIDLPFNIFTPEISSNSESTFENNNTHKDLIEYIELTSMVLEITSPDNGHFNFLNAIDIYISADNEPEVKIAWKENIPSDSSKRITLETSDEDLKKYLKKDYFKLRLETVTDEVITKDHQINVQSNFFVDAKILGI